ncbi:transglutaminase domain-containing protein [Acidobacteriota bacterium]
MRYRTLLWFSILLLASSNVAAQTGGPGVSPDELLAGTALGLDPDLSAIVSKHGVMVLSDDMREFLETHVSSGGTQILKLYQLGRAVISRGSFGVEYDETTRTAAETFAARRGNCLSFTFMFVVLARGAGIDARFQEVEIPPEWTFEKNTYILNRHINIYIDLGHGRERVVDFNIEDFETEYDQEVVSDNRALAHFYNNMGAELMQSGEMAEAFYAFRKAIAEFDRSFAPAWDNLGTLYLQALKIDKSDLIAMSNLTTLYDRRGDPGQAARYRKKVDSHRRENPYYRFQLARVAFYAEDYGRAIDHLKHAIRKHKDEDQFCALLGLAYLQMGDEEKSRRWMARAEEYAQTGAMKSVYSSKIDNLIAASRRGPR